MVTLSGPPSTATRNLPITPELQDILRRAAERVGVDTIQITSGGQPAKGESSRRTGSTRHDHGRAADIRLIADGAVLRFTDTRPNPVIADFITAVAALGVTGIGAGVDYMGPETIHVGFGTSPQDHTKLTWGADGRSARAPQWLRDAANAGWTPRNAVPASGPTPIGLPGRYAVIARDGLKLRSGPGPHFDSDRTLSAGTDIQVTGFDGSDRAWARVDLEGDGLLDGHVFAAFLAPVGMAPLAGEDAPEPN